VLFEAGGDGTEVLEFAEEAIGEVAVAIEEGAERRAAFPALDLLISPARLLCEIPIQGAAHVQSL
jgi:hypothetical protein